MRFLACKLLQIVYSFDNFLLPGALRVHTWKITHFKAHVRKKILMDAMLNLHIQWLCLPHPSTSYLAGKVTVWSGKHLRYQVPDYFVPHWMGKGNFSAFNCRTSDTVGLLIQSIIVGRHTSLFTIVDADEEMEKVSSEAWERGEVPERECRPTNSTSLRPTQHPTQPTQHIEYSHARVCWRRWHVSSSWGTWRVVNLLVA